MSKLGIATFFLTALGAGTVSGQSDRRTSDREGFIGSWTLVSWYAATEEGQRTFPFGEDALGRITYDDKGLMSVQIMRQRRTVFSTQDPLGENSEAVVEAFQGFLAYYGRYEVDQDAEIVTHFQEVASIPSWVGAEATRYYELSENRLILSTAPVVSGITGEQPARHTLIWGRLP